MALLQAADGGNLRILRVDANTNVLNNKQADTR
jgi:hypothetical protein